MTVIVSSHLLSEIDMIVDDIGIIANGKMMYQGTLSLLHETDKTKTLEQIFLDLTGKERERFMMRYVSMRIYEDKTLLYFFDGSGYQRIGNMLGAVRKLYGRNFKAWLENVFVLECLL